MIEGKHDATPSRDRIRRSWSRSRERECPLVVMQEPGCLSDLPPRVGCR